MYTIFVGDKPIVLTTQIHYNSHFKSYLLKSVNVYDVIKQLKKNTIKGVYLIHKNEGKLLKLFLKLLPNVIAGGGKVYNSKGDILFIYRNDKWDLPKGKIETGETIEATALREVEEETGVSDLKITETLPVTYHIFKRNDKYKIKITYWFTMTSSYSGPLVPQEKEGITKVQWLSETEVKTALNNSYANIKLLM